VALVARWLALQQFQGVVETHGDETYYLLRAQSIAAGEGHPGSHRPPVKERWVGADVAQGFDRPADVTVAAALEWLGAAPADRPLFLWLHLFDPHAPYDPPEELRRRFSSGHTGKNRKVALYDGAVAFADRELGRVAVAMRGRAPRDGTLIVLTADHGEGLSDHGFPGHNRSTYEEELRVPLVLAWEGRLEAASTVAGPAHLVDVLPTLAGLLGLEPPYQGRGIDLFGPGGVLAERPVFLPSVTRAAGRSSRRAAADTECARAAGSTSRPPTRGARSSTT